MRMVGPNCFGILNTDRRRSDSTPPPPHFRSRPDCDVLPAAPWAGPARRFWAIAPRLSTFVSVGNKADVSVNDLLQYWESDCATTVILLYVESFGNPRRFAHIARRVSRNKPIVALKAGRTASGKRAAGSHTAALAANDVAVEALFRQTGIPRADTLEDMFALAGALRTTALPKGQPRRHPDQCRRAAILCADACEAAGLEVPELSQATVTRLSPFLSRLRLVAQSGRFDRLGNPEQYEHAIVTLLSSDDIDALIILYIAVTSTDVAPLRKVLLAALPPCGQLSR